MSAWIVSKGHIDALVQGLVVEGLVEMSNAKQIGQMLWDENHASINYRYSEDSSAPEYEPEMIEAQLNDAILARQIACYGYQSCEHPEWETSEAYRLVSTLEGVLTLRNAPDSAPDERNWTYSYEAKHGVHLPWGINSIQACV